MTSHHFCLLAHFSLSHLTRLVYFANIEKNGGQAEQALGRSRGGFSTKIHVTTDALGNPLRVCLTAGQRHDIIKADDLIVDLDFEYVIADRSYGSQAFRRVVLKL